MNINNNKRNNFHDLAKGIGVILVIIGHCDTSNWFIYSFHMPLFFIVGGMLINIKQNFYIYIFKKLKAIITYYHIIAFIKLFYYRIFNNPKNFINDKSIYKNFLIIIYGLKGNNVDLWFFPAFYISEIIFFIFCKIFFFLSFKKKHIFNIYYYFFIALTGYFSIKYKNFLIKYSIGKYYYSDIYLIIIFFISLGYFFQQNQKFFNYFLKTKLLFPFLFFTYYFGYLNYIYNNKIRMTFYNLYIGRLDYFFISSISGCFSIFIIVNLIKNQKNLEYIGKYSGIYYAFQVNGLCDKWKMIINSLSIKINFLKIYYLKIIICSILILIHLTYINMCIFYVTPWLYDISLLFKKYIILYKKSDTIEKLKLK